MWMWKLQDLESAVIWSEKERCSSKVASRVGGAERAVLYFVFWQVVVCYPVSYLCCCYTTTSYVR